MSSTMTSSAQCEDLRSMTVISAGRMVMAHSGMAECLHCFTLQNVHIVRMSDQTQDNLVNSPPALSLFLSGLQTPQWSPDNKLSWNLG